MGKLTIQEISKILVEKNKLTSKEASQFAVMMFEVIQQNLNEGGMVKIKGLGTFKMIRVEARESVSVRTGERVVIDSHAKITFTPDATMKELVNKPFSQFDTVILNEGVEFEDIPEEEQEEEQEEVLDNVAIDNKLVEQKPFEVEQLPVEEEPVEEQPNAEQPVEKKTIEAEVKTVEEEKVIEEYITNEYEPLVDFDDKEESSSWKKILGFVLLTIVLMAASAYAGYWYGQHSKNGDINKAEEVVPEPVFVDSIETVTVDSVDMVEDIPAAEEPKEESSVEEKKEPAQEDEPFWKKYERMDARVRTGAYHIVGTDHEVVVKKGETLSRIAHRELGEGMSCYVEVYNGLKANTELKEGQVIKIPKLKWKKKRTLNN